MPTDKYFLDKDGVVIRSKLARPGEHHFDIALEVLASLGVKPADHADHFRQMFRLEYARVVERAGRVVTVEHGPELTAAQKSFIDRLTAGGRQVEIIQSERFTR